MVLVAPAHLHGEGQESMRLWPTFSHQVPRDERASLGGGEKGS